MEKPRSYNHTTEDEENGLLATSSGRNTLVKPENNKL